MRKKTMLAVLAGGHGLNDLIAGYFLGSLLHLQLDILEIGAGLLIYNLLAFGGQYPVALWLEKKHSPKNFLLGAITLNIAGVVLFGSIPHLAIVLAGVASAIYHVAGGSISCRENKALHVGLFAAPGVGGLILGGYFAFEGVRLIGWLLPFCLLFLILIWRMPIQPQVVIGKNVGDRSVKLDRHDMIMILLLTIISLRSAIWNIFQLLHDGNYHWLIAIGIVAVVGKIAGGWIADRIGWKLYAMISLAIAAPLLTLFKNELGLFCTGIGLLQSGIPATTSLLIKSTGGKTERGIALSFGVAIIGGSFLMFPPIQHLLGTDAMVLCASAVAILLLYFVRSTVHDQKQLISIGTLKA